MCLPSAPSHCLSVKGLRWSSSISQVLSTLVACLAPTLFILSCTLLKVPLLRLRARKDLAMRIVVLDPLRISHTLLLSLTLLSQCRSLHVLRIRLALLLLLLRVRLALAFDPNRTLVPLCGSCRPIRPFIVHLRIVRCRILSLFAVTTVRVSDTRLASVLRLATSRVALHHIQVLLASLLPLTRLVHSYRDMIITVHASRLLHSLAPLL